jgi:hypothetical protein
VVASARAARDQPAAVGGTHTAFGARRLLGRARRGLAGLLRLDGAAKALAVGLAADAVRLCVLDAGGMALDANSQRVAEIERLLV